jgi:hypothetical protein
MRTLIVATMAVLAIIAILVGLASSVMFGIGNPFMAGVWTSVIFADVAIGLAVPHRVVVVLVLIQLVLTVEQELRVLLVPIPLLPLVVETIIGYAAFIAAPLPAVAAAIVSPGWPMSGLLWIIMIVLAVALLFVAVLLAIPFPGSSPSTLPGLFGGYGIAAVVAIVRASRERSQKKARST